MNIRLGEGNSYSKGGVQQTPISRFARQPSSSTLGCVLVKKDGLKLRIPCVKDWGCVSKLSAHALKY